MHRSGASGNWRIYQDGYISYLEFHRLGNPGVMQIRALAKNQLGEAAADAVLTIEPQLDFRPELKHVEPENPFKKLIALRRVECSPELKNKMNRPKAQAINLRKVERASEWKGREATDAEVAETEALYSLVQSRLRTSRSSLPPSPAPPAPQALPVVRSQPPARPQPPPQQQQPQQQIQYQPVAQPQQQPPLPAPLSQPQPAQVTTVMGVSIIIGKYSFGQINLCFIVEYIFCNNYYKSPSIG
ncbi:unnamed protein product [Protopolystoma xenopodis]|uniref:Uncharacterized protein n=1 Tax=Protopolystoma xenopodis TaxID=117903 RepID=A0A3S5B8N0_9PLAT|nr:unnamed protein product [Protopolystoma xenopodis]